MSSELSHDRCQGGTAPHLVVDSNGKRDAFPLTEGSVATIKFREKAGTFGWVVNVGKFDKTPTLILATPSCESHGDVYPPLSYFRYLPHGTAGYATEITQFPATIYPIGGVNRIFYKDPRTGTIQETKVTEGFKEDTNTSASGEGAGSMQ